MNLKDVVQLRTKINTWGSWIMFQNNSGFVLNSQTYQPSLSSEVKQYQGSDKYIKSAHLWEFEPQAETNLCSAMKKIPLLYISYFSKT